MSDDRHEHDDPTAPISLDLEEAVLGALLIDPSNMAKAVHAVPEDLPVFLTMMGQRAWHAMVKRFNEGSVIDLALIAHDLSQDPDLAQAFGKQTMGQYGGRLTRCVERAGYSGHVLVHIEELVFLAVRREVMNFGAEIVTWASEEPDAHGLIRAVQQAALNLPLSAVARESGSTAEIGERLQARIAAGQAIGTKIGLGVFDTWAGGISRGHVTVLGAYTNVGKTWWAVTTANKALDAGLRVAFMSLEQDPEEIYMRFLVNRVGGFAYRMRHLDATYSPDESLRLSQGILDIERPELEIYSTDCRSVADIRSLVLAGDFDLVIVDYGQLLDPPKGARTEYESNTANARGLQALSKESGVATLILSQISQETQRRGASDPVMGFKSSGAWAEVADLGLMLSRDPDVDGRMVVRAIKNRHGPTVHAGAEAIYDMEAATGRVTEVMVGAPGDWR